MTIIIEKYFWKDFMMHYFLYMLLIEQTGETTKLYGV
jgi:hypothetical protein